MPYVAFYTFGILRALPGDPQVQGFFDRLDGVYAGAAAMPGFVARRTDARSIATTPQPRFFRDVLARETRPLVSPQTLSLWTNLEEIHAMAYRGETHAEALRLRREWFIKGDWPVYAAWWVADETLPEWEEAWERVEHLHDHGATPRAFTFIAPFDADGNRVVLRRERLVTPAL